MIEIIKANFFAGEVKTFLIQGEYVEILECAYPIDVAMMDRSGAQLSTMRNAEASYFSRPGKYEVIQVTSASAQTVRLFVGSGDAGTRRTSGDVSVIDGGKSRTLANTAFIASEGATGDATTAPAVYLMNPAGSGRNIVVKSFRVSFSAAQSYGLEWSLGVTGLDNSALAVVSKSNAGVFVAKVYRHTTGVLAAKSGTNSLATASLAANSVDYVLFTEPVVIRQGDQLKAFGTGSSSTGIFVFECIEEVV